MRHQPSRPAPARPHLRALARSKTIDAGFLLGVRQPEAKAQLAAQDAQALEMLVDSATRDLRSLQWISIDERTSRDLDQVSVADVLAGGETRLRVAIADVDAWIPQGSPLDDHAAGNATSIFTGVVSYPMLPEPLAHGRTSLVAGEDRLAIVVELIVEADGTVGAVDAYRAVIRNQAQLDYDEAGAWLDGVAAALPIAEQQPAIGEQLRLQEAAVQALHKRRLAAGALDLLRLDVQPIFNDDQIVDLLVVPPNRARALIEHLMTAVNAAIAAAMRASAMPWIARAQSPRDWAGLVEIAGELGYALPEAPERSAFGAFVQQLRATEPFQLAALQPVIARMIGGTEQRVIEPGEPPPAHYGLALDGYTRATAPIRRYADLVAQRLLKAAIAGRPAPYTVAELDELIEHCSERGRAAETVEREMLKIYGALLVQERTSEVFDATVTAANDYGVWARLDRPPVEGRLVRPDAGLERGDRIQVRVTRSNWERGYIDLTRVA